METMKKATSHFLSLVLSHKPITKGKFVVLKWTATLIISLFYNKEHYKTWGLIPVSSKYVEKLGSYGHLKISK